MGRRVQKVIVGGGRFIEDGGEKTRGSQRYNDIEEIHGCGGDSGSNLDRGVKLAHKGNEVVKVGLRHIG